ncbi:MAG: hypothetical protein KDI56_09505 [Xanthomonadales bacterium]|nr:hypothetical protein [Xanthomonadales bacterium]
MRKNPLAGALAAAVVGVVGVSNMATALNLSHEGVGQVLIYPFYSANGGNDTLISVVNTTANSKAVKVRFIEGYNSREVLDFNLYLSEYDVWAAAITDIGAGVPVLISRITGPTGDPDPGNSPLIDDIEDTCTVPPTGQSSPFTDLPPLPGGIGFYVPFRTLFLNDAGGQVPARMFEGYVEMIEMATIEEGGVVDGWVTHDFSGEPNGGVGCLQLEEAWRVGTPGSGITGATGFWASSGDFARGGLTPPSGGLFGGGAIVNVSDGTYYSYNAEAIDGFNSVVVDHTPPGFEQPSLATSRSVTGTITSNVFTQQGQLHSSNWGPDNLGDATTNGRIDAISHVLALDHVYNEWTTENALNASSEWVVTFPTKRFYVDNAIIGGGQAARRPFTRTFGSSGACEPVNLTVFDREENFLQILDFSPSAVGGLALCREVNVITFNQTGDVSDIFASPTARNIRTVEQTIGNPTKVFERGWMDLDLAGFGNGNPFLPPPVGVEHTSRVSNDGDVFYGLPVVGFWAVRIENQAQGESGNNYGGLYRHRGSRRCENDTVGTCGGTL